MHDLNEKIKADEALQKGSASESYKNLESAFLETLVKELEVMLPDVDS